MFNLLASYLLLRDTYFRELGSLNFLSLVELESSIYTCMIFQLADGTRGRGRTRQCMVPFITSLCFVAERDHNLEILLMRVSGMTLVFHMISDRIIYLLQVIVGHLVSFYSSPHQFPDLCFNLFKCSVFSSQCELFKLQ